MKDKARKIKNQGYDIYFNATSGLELWKFASFFIGSIEKSIDKFYYIPKDSKIGDIIKPLEIYMPIPISEPLKRLLILLN